MKVDNKQKLIVFVILHYNVMEETVNCVNSIKEKLSNNNYYIVIVDNCSPDGTGKILKELYEIEENICVLLNKQNEGFARGNNVGFLYAKQNLNADFIVLLNNDTLILDDDFYVHLVSEYERSHFAVLGPMIITPHPPYDSNPGYSKLPPVSYFKKILFHFYCLRIMNTFGLDVLYFRIKKIIGKAIISQEKDILTRMEHVRLHGCFLIFSKEYINKFDGLDPRTFLHREEELLFIRLIKNNLKSVYLPNIKIYHKEDAATKSITKSDRKKLRFIYKHEIHSTKLLIDELKTLI